MEIKFDNIIEGDHIILRKAEISDAEFIYHLRTSAAGRFLRQPKGYSVESQINWMKNRPANEINYIIVDKHTNTNVGTIGIYDINEQDLVANVGRLIIRESDLKKSTPYGLEALLLGYEYVFNRLNYRKITGDILATNTEMVKLQKFLGMSQEGYLKEHVFIFNEYVDLFIMSIFKNDFENTYKKKVNFLLKSFK